MTDNIEQPAHYDFGQMEAREIIELAIADFRDPATIYHVASALKYLLRASRKNGADDIAKARKHVGWALDAARAHDIRKLRDIPPPHYDPDSVAFRHGDVDKVCGLSRDPREILGEIAANANKAQQGALAGEFTQPPNCVHESTKSKNLGNVEIVDSAHPMAAEGLRLADEQPCNQPRRSESAWSVTWPGEEQYTPCAAYQALVGN